MHYFVDLVDWFGAMAVEFDRDFSVHHEVIDLS